jgi:hypothetical protein
MNKAKVALQLFACTHTIEHYMQICLRNLQIACTFDHALQYCTKWRGIFKGLSQDEGQTDFSKISAPLSLINTFQINQISAWSTSLDNIFNHPNPCVGGPWYFGEDLDPRIRTSDY